MYSWEIAALISRNNGVLTIEESKLINNTKDNPQLNHIIFHPFNNSYDLWDVEGNYFSYQVIIQIKH